MINRLHFAIFGQIAGRAYMVMRHFGSQVSWKRPAPYRIIFLCFQLSLSAISNYKTILGSFSSLFTTLCNMKRAFEVFFKHFKEICVSKSFYKIPHFDLPHRKILN